MIDNMMNELKRSVLSYASFVKDMMNKCIEGLSKRDSKLLLNIINDLEPYANIKELEIDEYCISSIAQFQPKGKILRQIIMSLKINNDLERIADHAVNIAEAGLELFKYPLGVVSEEIFSMASFANSMFEDAIASFSYEDSEKATSVCEQDDNMDKLNEKIILNFLSVPVNSVEEKSTALSLVLISRNLERVADLATNIAEDVYYIATGKVIKHKSSENL
ncbi:MAG: phosphate signaling complex protein PhoU [Exilispira sp.]|jgi:phosphate transport system protein|nr:phosphate signaling complex protein PhoU [Exilispira sp.]